MADEPIKTGAATGTLALIDEVGSRIARDEYGIDTGTVRFFWGNQATAVANRPAKGVAYAGALPQFLGSPAYTGADRFFCIEVPDIIGMEGTCVYFDAIYKKRDSGAAPVNEFDGDLQRIAVEDVSFTLAIPVVRVSYSSTTAPATLGTTKTSAAGVLLGWPAITDLTYTLNGVTYTIPDEGKWHCSACNYKGLADDAFFQIRETWRALFNFAGVTT